MKKQIIGLCLLLAMIMSFSSLFVMPVLAEDSTFEAPTAPTASDTLPKWEEGASETDWYQGGETAFTLTTPAQLAGLAVLVSEGNSFEGITISLGADINLNSVAWTAIGTSEKPFSGTFDGKGHTIYGLSGQALFCYISGATIQNVAVTGDVDMSGMDTTSPFYDATNILSSSGTYLAAGVIGTAVESDVQYVTNYVNVYMNDGARFIAVAVAGVVAYAQSSLVTHCQNFGHVQAVNGDSSGQTHAAAGGVVGMQVALSSSTHVAETSYCENYGIIMSAASNGQSTARAGGIVAGAKGVSATVLATIRDCVNHGIITCAKNDAAFAGEFGGIAGSLFNYSMVENCTNRGTIHTEGNEADKNYNTSNYKNNLASVNLGGIIGGEESVQSATTIYCANYGTVNGARAAANAGGLVGHIYMNGGNNADFKYSVNFGAVSSIKYAGGFIGHISRMGRYSSFTGCVNYGDITAYYQGTGEVAVGGFSGYLGTDNTNYNHDTQHCVNYGDVKVVITEAGASLLDAYARYAGGFAGKTNGGRVKYCQSYGTVSGGNYVGGLAGYQSKGSSFNHCVSYNSLVTDGCADAFVGYTALESNQVGEVKYSVFAGTVDAAVYGTTLADPSITLNRTYCYTTLADGGLSTPEEKAATLTAMNASLQNQFTRWTDLKLYANQDGIPTLLEEIGPKVEAASITLQDSLAINFYVKKVELPSGVTYTVSINGDEVESNGEVTNANGTYERYTVEGISASHLTGSYTIVINIKDSYGTAGGFPTSVPVSSVYTYSVFDYMKNKYDTTGENEALNNLIVALAQYATAAEQAKGKVSMFASAFEFCTGADLPTLDEAYTAANVTLTPEETVITNGSITEASLVLADNIQAIYRVSNDVARVVVYLYEEETELIPVDGEVMYTGIMPSSLNTPIVITTYDAEGNMLDSVTWSVSTFLSAGLASDGWSAEYKQLAKALALYMTRTNEYRISKGGN